MKQHIITYTLIAFTLCFSATASIAQQDGVYIIFDASGSMWGKLPDKTIKIEAARRVLKQFVQQDFSDKQLALRAYGHNRKDDCSDTQLVVPFSSPEMARPRITSFADSVIPKGRTPISRSLREAIADFGDRGGEIILISDGLETCDEDPCELVRAWRKTNIKISIHVIGLGLNAKEKSSMECISKAAGTEYLDAQSAEELSEKLKKVHSKVTGNALIIKASTEDGRAMKVKGSAKSESGEIIKIASHSRNRVPPGKYALELGIETRNGDLYQAVSTSIQVRKQGETLHEVVVQEPPSVKALFSDQGKQTRGSLVTAFQKGKAVFTFRWIDRAYLNPGKYEFRSQLNPENKLSVSETFAAGDHKEITFQLAHTVHAKIKMVASGSGIDFRENYELWQNDEKVKSIHWVNGVQALPGKYELRLANPVTPYIHKELKLSAENEQSFRIIVPVGHVTVIYQDANGKRDQDVRCWINRQDGNKWIKGKTSQSAKKIPLIPGSYRVKGWDRKGKSYDLAPFTITEGEEKEIILQAKE